MNALGLLEGKIKVLLELASKLKDENTKLKAEKKELLQKNEEFEKKIKSFECAVVQNSKNLDELSHVKELTKVVVDDLIKSIDSLVEENRQ